MALGAGPPGRPQLQPSAAPVHLLGIGHAGLARVEAGRPEELQHLRQAARGPHVHPRGPRPSGRQSGGTQSLAVHRSAFVQRRRAPRNGRRSATGAFPHESAGTAVTVCIRGPVPCRRRTGPPLCSQVGSRGPGPFHAASRPPHRGLRRRHGPLPVTGGGVRPGELRADHRGACASGPYPAGCARTSPRRSGERYAAATRPGRPERLGSGAPSTSPERTH